MSHKAIKPAATFDIDAFNMAENVQQQSGGAQPVITQQEKDESPSTKDKRTNKGNKVNKKTEKKDKKDLKTLPKDISQKISDNFLRYDRSADKGMSMFIPTEINEALKEISNEKYKRLSARTIASAILATVIENYDIDAVIEQFFENINYSAPTDKQLEERRKATERVRKHREK